MPMIHTIITVKGDEVLERAIASEIAADTDVPESFLQEFSTPYRRTAAETKPDENPKGDEEV